MNLLEKIILKLIQRKISRWFETERSLSKRSNSLTAVESSPEKTWPDPAKIPEGGEIPFSLKNMTVVGPLLRSCIHQGSLAIESLKDNPSDPKSRVDPEFLEEFERHARSLGIGAVGYTRLPRKLIFKERAVLFENAIVLLKEMDKDKIAKAPSLETFKMIFETYDSLGKIVNELTDYLRKRGYGAQGGHPLGGLVLYPPLASLAGLGWLGRHGLLISPQFGPRQRIGAIFTNIENLPFAGENSHSWIEDFCAACGLCIRACPSKAIYEEPIVHESGRKTHISREKCLPVFVKEHACTVCVKACVFAKTNYNDIYNKFMRLHAASSNE
ncbi:4Fe-4S binding protein [Thermodesulfobacteriota bacterium]